MAECFCSAIYAGNEAWRRDLWVNAFGKAEVPIVPPLQIERAVLAGEFSNMYRLDKARIEPDQLERLAAGIAHHFHIPIEEVRQEMNNKPMPINARDVVVTTCQLHVHGPIP